MNKYYLRLKELMQTIREMNTKLDRLESLINTINSNRISSGFDPSHISLPDNTAIVRIFTGQKMFVGLDDTSIGPHITLDGVWEQHITSAWQSFLNKDSVVLDIGANYGYYGVLASGYVNAPIGEVHYFEPNPSLVGLINKTVALNFYGNKSIVNQVAVSDRPGKAKLTILENYIGCSSLSSEEQLRDYLGDLIEVKAASVVDVDTITIDNYCKDHKLKNVNLIKLDIEGFEDKAYDGMRKTVQSSKYLVLFLEFTNRSYQNPKKFFSNLMEDFDSVSLISDDGELTIIKNPDISRIFEDDVLWKMMVFRKGEKDA